MGERTAGRATDLMPGRVAGIRAMLRIARRDIRRNRGRSTLVALLVALPILGASWIDLAVRSNQLDPQDIVAMSVGELAQAQLRFDSLTGAPIVQSVDGQSGGSVGESSTPPPTAAALTRTITAALPPGTRLLQQLTQPSRVQVGRRSVEAGLTELDLTDRALNGLVSLRRGRYPQGADEVAVSAMLARTSGATVGDPVQITVPAAAGTTGSAAGRAERRTVTIVGEVDGFAVADPDLIGRPGSLFPPQAGQDPRRYDLTGWMLAVGPQPVTWDQVLKLNQLGVTVVSRAVLTDPPAPERVPWLTQQQQFDSGASAVNTQTLLVLVAAGLVVLEVVLLAGPAMAVGVRRNQRMLALVASTGAERRHLRGLVLGNAAVLGLGASLVGALLAVPLAMLTLPVLTRRIGSPVPRTDVHLLDLGALVALGTLTAVAAAVIPARQAARIDVVAALAGRRGQASPKLHVPLAGALVASVGFAVALFFAIRHQPLPVLAGLAAGELGVVAMSGALVALAGRAARRMPISLRLALRDAARQRHRTAPAVAAVLAAVAGGTAALLYVAAQDRHDREDYTPSAALGTVTVQAPGPAPDAPQPPPVDWSRVEASLRQELPLGSAVVIHGLSRPGGGGVYPELLRSPAQTCPVTDQQSQPERAALLARDPRCVQSEVGVVSTNFNGVVDDGTAARLLLPERDPGAEAALRAGKVVISDPRDLWPDGTAHLSLQPYNDDGTSEPAIPVVLPAHLLATRVSRVTLGQPLLPTAVLKITAAAGVDLQPLGLAAGTTRLPTEPEQQAAAGALATQFGGASGVPGLQVERGYVSAYGLGLLALVIAAGFVTLSGTMTAAGLAASEGRADLATLAAIGAAPGLRRRLAAGQYGVICWLGVGMGLLVGGLSAYVLIRLTRPVTPDGGWLPGNDPTGGWKFTVPWPYLLVLAVGLPLLASGIGFVSTRSRLVLVRRFGQ